MVRSVAPPTLIPTPSVTRTLYDNAQESCRSQVPEGASAHAQSSTGSEQNAMLVSLLKWQLVTVPRSWHQAWSKTSGPEVGFVAGQELIGISWDGTFVPESVELQFQQAVKIQMCMYLGLMKSITLLSNERHLSVDNPIVID
jgi:hypothetical protein